MLEQLEPRLLLSAGYLDPQLFSQNHDLSEGPVISVGLNGSSESYGISGPTVSTPEVQVPQDSQQPGVTEEQVVDSAVQLQGKDADQVEQAPALAALVLLPIQQADPPVASW